MLKLENISKKYKDKTIFENANIEAKMGQLVLLTGRSGSGKSTMLDIIAGMRMYDSGEYYFDEKKINAKNDELMSTFRNQIIGYIVQDFGLIEDYSVKENIVLPSYYNSHVNKTSVLEKAYTLASKFKLKSIMDEKVKNISGGQKQRVALIRSLILNPRIIIADEPTTNLDIENVNLVMETFQELKSQEKILIIATHDKRFYEIADKVYQIKKYKLVLDKD